MKLFSCIPRRRRGRAAFTPIAPIAMADFQALHGLQLSEDEVAKLSTSYAFQGSTNEVAKLSTSYAFQGSTNAANASGAGATTNATATASGAGAEADSAASGRARLFSRQFSCTSDNGGYG